MEITQNDQNKPRDIKRGGYGFTNVTPGQKLQFRSGSRYIVGENGAFRRANVKLTSSMRRKIRREMAEGEAAAETNQQ